ncbi:MAG: hypothetical protein C0501_09840 [Isosphaera sp.]|nr:hypothetical protein [Isosphaera sp.]
MTVEVEDTPVLRPDFMGEVEFVRRTATITGASGGPWQADELEQVRALARPHAAPPAGYRYASSRFDVSPAVRRATLVIDFRPAPGDHR